MIYIYGLLCPVRGKVRYVGKTDNLKRRLKNHIADASSGKYKHHASNWIKGLLAKGLQPSMIVLRKVRQGDDWQAAERECIAAGIAAGWPLTNSTAGGDGVPDLDKASRDRKSAAMKGKWKTQEYRDRILAHRNSPEFVAAQGERLRRRWADPAARERVRSARWTDEARSAQAAEISSRGALMNASVPAESRARQGAKMRELWKDEKRKESARERMSPERIAKMRAAVTPQGRERQRQKASEWSKEYWRRKKEAANEDAVKDQTPVVRRIDGTGLRIHGHGKRGHDARNARLG